MLCSVVCNHREAIALLWLLSSARVLTVRISQHSQYTLTGGGSQGVETSS